MLDPVVLVDLKKERPFLHPFVLLFLGDDRDGDDGDDGETFRSGSSISFDSIVLDAGNKKNC